MHTSSASQRRSILTKGQHRRLAIAALTASSLLASLLSAGTASAQTEPSPHPKGSDQSAAQSELTEAVEQAKSTGKPVQLPSLTTETSTSEVTPAGKITTRITSGPVRVKDANGNWQKIDTDLERSGNTLQPKAAKADIKFSGGGSGPFAEFRRSDGTSLSLGWEGQLPQPAIEGNKAIYRGVAGEGAGDLVATALPTGLRFDVVLNRKPTSPVEVHIPITPQGLTLGDNEGNLKVSDSAGEVIAISSKPAMWDSNASNKGLTSRIGHLAAIRHGRSGPITSKVIDKTGGKVFVLKPSMDFLNDPETTYPVTVDPSVALPLNGDTDVDSENDWNNVDGEYLTAGTQGTQKSRIYLAFDTRGLPAITSAQLSLTNFDAPSCGATVGAGIQVRRITGFWHADTQTWTPQPTNTTDGAVTNTAGIDSTCATWPGQMTWNVTTIVSAWASGTAPNHGLVLQSPTETTSNNYRVFTSSENTDDFGPPPTLTVTSDTVFIPGEGEDPADPGPEDFRPGQVDVDTGSWVISGIDVFEDGLVTTRSHSAGQRTDVARPNEAVLGPNWRLEPLGGILRSRLVDNSSNGYLQFVYSTGTESVRFLANQAQPGTFTGDDGATIVKNADGTFTQSGGEFQITLVWTQVGSEYLITSLGAADTGMQTISYDTQGRVTRLVSPATQGVCPTPDAPGCASVTFQYATATTATTSQLGDVAGQVKSISYDAPGDVALITAVRYAYDSAKRLREVQDVRQTDGEPIKVTSYNYDTAGNITRLTSAADGTWDLTYAAPGKLSTATQVAPPSLGRMAAAASCAPYAADYMLYGRCPHAVDVQQGTGVTLRSPYWQKTKTGASVMGVNNDGCSAPVVGDYPVYWLNFRVACNSHDYGYGLIRSGYLARSKRPSVDAVFQTILTQKVCPGYPKWDPVGKINKRAACMLYAVIFYNAVRARGDTYI